MKINKREKIDYVIIYLLLYISNSFTLSIFSGTTRILMYLGLVIIMVVSNLARDRNIRIRQMNLLIFIFILLNITTTVLVNEEGFKQLIITTSLFFVAFIYSGYYSFRYFIEKYIKVIFFLSVFSLIIYFLALFLPELIMKLPKSHNSVGIIAYDAIFSTIIIDGYLIRNQSIFWEPGAFQTYINLALIFNLFFFKENHIRNLFVFGVALFTTYSTTGYIVGLVIIFAFLLDSLSINSKKSHRRKISMICVIITLLIAGIIFYDSLPNNAKYQLFGKVSVYLETGDRSSTSIRIDAIKIPIQKFLENPIFGNGSLRMVEIAKEYGYKMNTATMVNWFSMFGLFIGFIMNYGIFKLCIQLKCKKHIRLLLYVAFLFAIASEDYVRNPSILLFVFYGYHYITQKIDTNKLANKKLNI